MSSSLYRGKLSTSPEIRGPFTEAADRLEGKAFKLLTNAVVKDADIIGETYCRVQVVRTKFKPHSVIISTISGISIEITEDGRFEIFEGGA
jgi:hypothetical protein